MYNINIIEIDFDGEVEPARQFAFDFLPRINEKIILYDIKGEQTVYKILDVHFIPGEKINVYVTYDKTLKNVLRSLANQIEY